MPTVHPQIAFVDSCEYRYMCIHVFPEGKIYSYQSREQDGYIIVSTEQCACGLSNDW